MKGRSNRSNGNRLRLLTGGEELFSVLFGIIDKAKEFIHIQVYILADDITGRELLQRLYDAASRGVEVYLMIDDFGSADFPVKEESRLRAAGILVKRFAKAPRLRNFRMGRRLHSKIVVIDNRQALVGGMNFADRYSGMDGKLSWLDFALLVEGPAASAVNRMASVYWKKKIRNHLNSYKGCPPLPEGMELRWTFNDWLRNRFEISRSYRLQFTSARDEIWIVASYFVPGMRLLRILKRRSEAGVKINIILSRESDVPFIKQAMEYLYRFLLKRGMTIYEWSPSILHAKLAVVDKRWVTIGSYNLNQLSDWGSLETNAETTEPAFASKVLETIHKQILPGCQRIEAMEFLRVSLLGRIRQVLSFILVRLALRLLFITSRKRF